MTDTELFNKSLEKIQTRKAIEDTPEIIELRRLRDESTEKAQEYQNQIDEKIKSVHQVPDLIDKYIKISKDNQVYYGLVRAVKRLFDGIRIFYHYTFNQNNYAIGSIVTLIDDGHLCYSNIVYWDDIPNIEFITKEEFNSILLEIVNDFIQHD